MVQEITDKAWLAEARTEETKRFIQDIKRVTRRRFSAGQNQFPCCPPHSEVIARGMGNSEGMGIDIKCHYRSASA
ncbi:MAG: hypothetical protein ISS53_00865 [Dehalococcoidia bacterium]|nr:hypothetical protein [Dehalococcoidia bacterium]